MIKDPEVYDEIQESISQKQGEILRLEQNSKNSSQHRNQTQSQIKDKIREANEDL